MPGPLTQEMEARQATRKKEQKAARRQREQQQRKQKEQEEQEQEEQQRFAALSDREKVSLALAGFCKCLPPLPRLSCYFLSALSISGTFVWNIFSVLQRALAAERRLAAQLGAPSPPVPDSAVVNAGYGDQGMSERVGSCVLG